MTVTENLVTVVHANHKTENLNLPTSPNDTKFHYPVHRCLNVQPQKKYLSVLAQIFTVC